MASTAARHCNKSKIVPLFQYVLFFKTDVDNFWFVRYVLWDLLYHFPVSFAVRKLGYKSRFMLFSSMFVIRTIEIRCTNVS